MSGICSDCRYKGTCGETSLTQHCEGKKKFARSTPDKWGYMEYCVEVVTTPYEFERCKNRTEAKRKVQEFKKQGKIAYVTGLTQNGNDYIIKM